MKITQKEIFGGFGSRFMKTFDLNHAKVMLPHFTTFPNFATVL
jgi:hypothetical protein